MRLAALTFALALLIPAAAGAAPFGEPRFTPAPGSATCLRATGLPGELVRLSDSGARFVQAGAGGFTDSAEVGAGGRVVDCPAAAAQPNGAGVVAIMREDVSLHVSLREPGATTWSAAATLAGAQPLSTPSVAVSERGDAAIAWVEESDPAKRISYRLRVARRPAGGPFGAPQTLATLKGPLPPDVFAGVSASGETIVAWITRPSGKAPAGPVAAAIAPAGGAFATPVRVGAASEAALAVAPDGRALAALAGGGEMLVAERPPGGAFGAPAHVADAPDLLAVLPTVAIRPDGGAVVAWQGLAEQSISAVTRTAAGAFGGTLVIARTPLSGGDPIQAAVERIFTVTLGGANFGASQLDPGGGDLRAAIAPDGRALLTWAGLRTRSGISTWVAPRMAAFPLAGGHLDAQVLGGPLRNAGSIAPVLLPGGAPTVAWTDNPTGFTARTGRLRLALEGVATAADPPAPKILVGRPSKTVLSVDDPLELSVHCDGPCELRAAAVGKPGADAATELQRAGNARLAIQPSVGSPIAPLRRGPVRVTIAYGAPGARRPLTKTVTFSLRRPPSRPVARVRDLRAHRRGNAIAVSWTTDLPAKPDDFLVTGAATRAPDAPPLAFALSGGERTSRSFHITLRPAKGVRYVSVAISTETLRIVRRATVRVR